MLLKKESGTESKYKMYEVTTDRICSSVAKNKKYVSNFCEDTYQKAITCKNEDWKR